MIIPEERRDYSTRPENIWRCEVRGCNYWEHRFARQVNAVPTCPYCVTGYSRHGLRRPRLWEAVRRKR